MALGFVDLEKAFDTIPREMVILRWMEVPEAELGLVEGMYKGMKGRVLICPEMSETLVLMQGSTLSPLMFIRVSHSSLM